jgi:catechol 2,3-dioxygenase-like lactoylglutathione lyase family enzyme
VIGHLSFGVADLARAASFYERVLAPIGFVRVWTTDNGAGFGPPGGNDAFALFAHAEARAPGRGFHLAFNAPGRAAVDAFHKAAVEAGGKDAGAPGLRPHYGATYYAAFVIDLDGYKIEAVHQAP